MYSYDKTKLIIDSISRNDKLVWNVLVEGDCNDADDVTIPLRYTEEGFLEEGFPLALLLNKLKGKDIWDFDWTYDLLLDGMECIPRDEIDYAHTITDVKVLGKNVFLDLDEVDENDAKEIIRRFLIHAIEYDEETTYKIINDAFAKGRIR